MIYASTSIARTQRKEVTVHPQSRMVYASWWYSLGEFTESARNCMQRLNPDPESGEDLEDVLDMIASLHSFLPNPLAFDPPITIDDATAWVQEWQDQS